MHTLEYDKKESSWKVGILTNSNRAFYPLFNGLGFNDAVALVHFLNGGSNPYSTARGIVHLENHAVKG